MEKLSNLFSGNALTEWASDLIVQLDEKINKKDGNNEALTKLKSELENKIKIINENNNEYEKGKSYGVQSEITPKKFVENLNQFQEDLKTAESQLKPLLDNEQRLNYIQNQISKHFQSELAKTEVLQRNFNANKECLEMPQILETIEKIKQYRLDLTRPSEIYLTSVTNRLETVKGTSRYLKTVDPYELILNQNPLALKFVDFLLKKQVSNFSEKELRINYVAFAKKIEQEAKKGELDKKLYRNIQDGINADKKTKLSENPEELNKKWSERYLALNAVFSKGNSELVKSLAHQEESGSPLEKEFSAYLEKKLEGLPSELGIDSKDCIKDHYADFLKDLRGKIETGTMSPEVFKSLIEFGNKLLPKSGQ